MIVSPDATAIQDIVLVENTAKTIPPSSAFSGAGRLVFTEIDAVFLLCNACEHGACKIDYWIRDKEDVACASRSLHVVQSVRSGSVPLVKLAAATGWCCPPRQRNRRSATMLCSLSKTVKLLRCQYEKERIKEVLLGKTWQPNRKWMLSGNTQFPME